MLLPQLPLRNGEVITLAAERDGLTLPRRDSEQNSDLQWCAQDAPKLDHYPEDQSAEYDGARAVSIP